MEQDTCTRAVTASSQDLKAARREYLFPVPGWCLARLVPLLRDERDVPVLCLFCNVLAVCVPAACVLFCARPSHLLGAVYLASIYVAFLKRFLVALLHIVEHRKLFRTGVDCWEQNVQCFVLLCASKRLLLALSN